MAVDGGPRVRSTPLPPWPSYEPDEVEAASRVLRSGKVNYWTGEECRAFEREFAAYHGVGHAVALANGTLALELALRVLGVGPGDEVVVTPRSYFASVSSVVLAGAKPVFAEVDESSQLVTPTSIEAVLTPRTRAILVVHLAGWPCDMPAIMRLARERDLKVIEDCAQAVGARIDGRLVGTFGDVSAFSFCQDKIITTAGEGGMLVTDDRDLWSAAWSFKDHGKSWERVYADDHPVGFRWLHEGFGSNWRLTEIQGAIGRLQLAKLDGWLTTRREHAARLTSGLADVAALRTPQPPAGVFHPFYKFYTFVRPERLRPGWSRDRILISLAAEGIPGLSGSCPEIYREAAFEEGAFRALPVAHRLGETSMMLMVHPTLGPADIDDMIRAVRKVMRRAST
ncbi:MAG: DegT/DnrJ/EryC1/StrS family aminotransferase [Chloroflexi bacterium]|nr:DegT/DnrJ/EryC1/StrS family aminotransferase [Chloroflexota bacterium]